MIIAVVDTNVFINALFGKDRYKYDEKILGLEEQGIIKFGFSKHTLNELYRIVAKKIEEHNIFECSEFFHSLYMIEKRSKFIEKAPRIREKLSSDPGDQYFIELAAILPANYLITNDKKNGLLELGTYKEVRICTPEKFVKQFRSQMKRQSQL